MRMEPVRETQITYWGLSHSAASAAVSRMRSASRRKLSTRVSSDRGGGLSGEFLLLLAGKERQDLLHVIERFRVIRQAAGLGHLAGAGIKGAQRQRDVTAIHAEELLEKVRAGTHVLLGIEGVGNPE